MLDPDIIGAEFRQGSSEIVGSNPAPATKMFQQVGDSSLACLVFGLSVCKEGTSMKNGKASRVVLYVVTAFVTVVGIIGLVCDGGLEWCYILPWAILVVLCIVDLVMSSKKQG